MNDVSTSPTVAHESIPLPRVRSWAVALALLVGIAAFGGLFALGWFPRAERLAALERGRATSDDRVPVEVVTPTRDDRPFDLRLPADLRPFQETSVVARANGYLGKLLVDVGDRVESGQLLATVDAPELDAELAKAKAAVQLAQADVVRTRHDVELADSTLERYSGYAQSGGVTPQQLDEKRSATALAHAALDTASANVAVAEAEVRRLATLQSFQRVTAPFAGTVTARRLDVGALLTPAASGGSELFRVAQTDTLRVFADVPQTHVGAIAVGAAAQLTVRNAPGREFAGTVTRTTGVLDPATRTLRVEVDVDNRDHALVAGMFGELRFHVTRTPAPTLVPTSALVVDAKGTHVWTVRDQRVHLVDVAIGVDHGTTLEVADGLAGDVAVVSNPSERLVEDAAVRVVEKAKSKS